MAEVDIAAVFQLLGTVAGDVRDLRREVAELTRSKADKADVASLRQALTEYHSSVVGHGVLISDLEDRVRRIERHLGLPPVAAE
jgi:hypothetical protein